MIKNLTIAVLACALVVCAINIYKKNCTDNKIMSALESSKIDFYFSEPDSFKDTLTVMAESDPKNYRPYYYKARDLYISAIKDFQNDIDDYNEKFGSQPIEIKIKNGKTVEVMPTTRQLPMADNMIKTAMLVKQERRIGEIMQAKGYISTSLKLNPSFIEGYILRGRINSRLGFFAQAYEDFKKAYELGGKKDEDLLFLISNMEQRKVFEIDNRPLDMEYLSLGEAEEMYLSTIR